MARGQCQLCQQWAELEVHHIFPGKGLRPLSDRYGATMRLCRGCHQTSDDAVHKNGETMKMVKKYGQRKVMSEQGWNLDKWLNVFGKSYLEPEEIRELCENQIEAAEEAEAFCITEEEDWMPEW